MSSLHVPAPQAALALAFGRGAAAAPGLRFSRPASIAPRASGSGVADVVAAGGAAAGGAAAGRAAAAVALDAGSGPAEDDAAF